MTNAWKTRREPRSPGIQEVEQRPQVAQAVLDRRAGQRDAGAGGQRAHRPALPRGRVLDGLRLVQDHQPPLDVRQPGLPLQHGVGRHRQIDAGKLPRRRGGDLRQRLAIRLGRVQEAQDQRRREPLRLAPPVPEERGGDDQQGRPRPASAVFPVPEQQRQHLHGLAEPHVVGQAGAEPQARQQPEPRHAVALVGPQRGPQRPAGGHRLQRTRLTHARQQLAHPVAGGHVHPGTLHLRLVLAPEVGGRAGEQAHPLDERDPVVPRVPAHLVPVLDRLPEPVAVDLHPLPLEQHEVAVAGEQRLDLRVRQRLPGQRDGDVEVQHRVRADHRRRPASDGDADPRPRPLAPPVRQSHGQAGRLQLRHAAQQPIGAIRRPRQRLVDLARVDERPHPRARLRGLLDRRQQRDERRPVPGAGILRQRPAQGQVPHPSARREPGGVRRQEGERPLLVVRVLRQVEADPPHLVPARGPRPQERRQPAGLGRRLPDPRVQVAPDPPQALLGEVLAPAHRRGGQDPGGAVGRPRRLDLDARLLLRQLAQRRQVPLAYLLPEARGRRSLGVDPLRRQGEERLAPVGRERRFQAREAGWEGVAVARRPAEMPGRRQSEAHEGRSVTSPISLRAWPTRYRGSDSSW